MIVQIKPSKLQGKVHIPPSKSVSHRALLAAALADGESVVENLLQSRDIDATQTCLENLGVAFTNYGTGVRVLGQGKPRQIKESTFPCHESGSTLRFMIPLAMLPGKTVTFTGAGRLIKRPITPYLKCFEELNIPYIYNGQLPLTTNGPLVPGVYRLPGNVSSQFVTGLLYALPLLDSDSKIELTTVLESKGYVDMTIEVLSQFGVRVENQSYETFLIPGRQTYKQRTFQVEGDHSQAAFWAVAAAIGHPVVLQGISRKTQQGDIAIFEILEQMGATVTWSADGVHIEAEELFGVKIDVSEIPDLVPALAVAGTFAVGTTCIVGGERVRLKESDRLHAMAVELAKMGVKIEETDDGLIIQGGQPLSGTRLHGWNDHRIVMALAVAASCAQGTTEIEDAEAITKSYPTFFQDYRQIGGVADERNMG